MLVYGLFGRVYAALHAWIHGGYKAFESLRRLYRVAYPISYRRLWGLPHFLRCLYPDLWTDYEFEKCKRNADDTGDPWNGRTLEWSIPSPPPFYNFAIIPVVNERDAFWASKQKEGPPEERPYEDILMPKNGPIPLFIGILSLLFGFAMIWYIWPLALVSFLGIVVCLIVRLSGTDEHELITAAEVERIEMASLGRRQPA